MLAPVAARKKGGRTDRERSSARRRRTARRAAAGARRRGRGGRRPVQTLQTGRCLHRHASRLPRRHATARRSARRRGSPPAPRGRRERRARTTGATRHCQSKRRQRSRVSPLLPRGALAGPAAPAWRAWRARAPRVLSAQTKAPPARPAPANAPPPPASALLAGPRGTKHATATHLAAAHSARISPSVSCTVRLLCCPRTASSRSITLSMSKVDAAAAITPRATRSPALSSARGASHAAHGARARGAGVCVHAPCTEGCWRRSTARSRRRARR
jgi:hypothetical protein